MASSGSSPEALWLLNHTAVLCPLTEKPFKAALPRTTWDSISFWRVSGHAGCRAAHRTRPLRSLLVSKRTADTAGGKQTFHSPALIRHFFSFKIKTILEMLQRCGGEQSWHCSLTTKACSFLLEERPSTKTLRQLCPVAISHFFFYFKTLPVAALEVVKKRQRQEKVCMAARAKFKWNVQSCWKNSSLSAWRVANTSGHKRENVC